MARAARFRDRLIQNGWTVERACWPGLIRHDRGEGRGVLAMGDLGVAWSRFGFLAQLFTRKWSSLAEIEVKEQALVVTFERTDVHEVHDDRPTATAGFEPVATWMAWEPPAWDRWKLALPESQSPFQWFLDEARQRLDRSGWQDRGHWQAVVERTSPPPIGDLRRDQGGVMGADRRRSPAGKTPAHRTGYRSPG
jgi:hypothetical protein